MLERVSRGNEIYKVFLESLGFIKGKTDYQDFVLGKRPVPSLIVNGRRYVLVWHPFFNPRDYIEKFRAILSEAEVRSTEGDSYHVRLKKYKRLDQFLPIQPDDVKRQLFGFGQAALNVGDLETALPALRASGTLGKVLVLRQLKDLAVREEVKLYLQLKILMEEAEVKSSTHRLETAVGRERIRAERALGRATQAIEVYKKVLST